MKYHEKVQEIIDKVASGELEPDWYVIQIDDEYDIRINFYPNKQIWYIHNLKNDKPHGICAGWFANGNMKYIDNRKNGKMHGKSEEWNSAGTKKLERVFDNGKLIEDVNL